MARAALGESAGKIAQQANVSVGTIYSLERGQRVRPSTVLALQRVFEDAGVVFHQNDEGDVGVILKPFTISVE
jgi:DNA-binding XRE family transcriptional regulator